MLRYQLSTGSRALQQTQLFNYLYSNINFSSNKTLCARTDQQKCILPACSITLHYSVVAMWYSLNKAPYSQQIARTTSYWLSIIQMSKENGLSQLMWCIFFYLHFVWLLNCDEQKKRHRYIAFDCIRLCKCSQSVNFIVNIHQCLMAWMPIGCFFILCSSAHAG